MREEPRVKPIFDYKYGYRNAINFLRNELSAKEYIASHHDSRGSNRLEWNELLLLRANMHLYREYLLKFSLMDRRRVLINDEIIGFSRRDLFYLYGIAPDTVGRFIGQKNTITRKKHPPEIRDIMTENLFPKEFVAFISLLSRVPFQWLEVENPEQRWSTDYFYYLPEPIMSGKQFINYIKSQPIDIHDVRGIIIKLEDSDKLFIRMEWLYGGFIIELFNTNASLRVYRKLRELLASFDLQVGYTKTVISTQDNFTLICKYKSSKPICTTFPLLNF